MAWRRLSGCRMELDSRAPRPLGEQAARQSAPFAGPPVRGARRRNKQVHQRARERRSRSPPGRLHFLALMKLQSARYQGEPLCLRSAGGWSSAASSGEIRPPRFPPPASRAGLAKLQTRPPHDPSPSTSDRRCTGTFRASGT